MAELKQSLVEGRIQHCDGYLERRSKHLKRWKKEHIEIILRDDTAFLLQHEKHRLKHLHTFSKSSPGFVVKPLSDYIGSPDFMSFCLIDKAENANEREMFRFKADGIVDMRRFMASLGGSGQGLFSPKIEAQVYVNEDAEGSGSQIESGSVAYSLPACPHLVSYSDALSRLPIGFYHSILSDVTTLPITEAPAPGAAMPIFDASNFTPQTNCRVMDTFRPPLGKPVEYLYSLGCGWEVGLPDGVHEIYNPCTGRSFFMDHLHQTLFNTFSRRSDNFTLPSQSTHCIHSTVFQLNSQHIDPGIPAHIKTPLPLALEASERASSKEAKYILRSSGGDGRDGLDGRDGKDGEDAWNEGSDGSYGESGEDGENGADGDRGGDVNIILSGTASQLHVTGSTKAVMNFSEVRDDGVFVVDSHGGNGGAGGRGGNGGIGGTGATGEAAKKGGDGGRGGNGGYGGRGGNGGAGGNCLIQTKDPKLMVLAEVNCLGGKGCHGGRQGRAGQGGKPGEGGVESGGGRSSRDPYYSSSPPKKGPDGDFGYSGSDGEKGTAGEAGANGGILWVVLSPTDNHIIEESHTRFEPKMEGFGISPALIGGVFEPCSRISVSGIVVSNTGGLTLPEGTKVFLSSSSTVKFEPSFYEFPRNLLKPGETIAIPCEFQSRLSDLPCPNSPGPQFVKAEIESQIEIFGRRFPQGSCKQELTIQYPVQLGDLVGPESLARGEMHVLTFQIKNVSSFNYGNCSNSSGGVVLQLHLDSSLVPLGTLSPQHVLKYTPGSPDSLFVEVSEVPPNQAIGIEMMVRMDGEAELFKLCHYQVDLYLRGKLIEYNQHAIRVSPTYTPQRPPADVLFVTSEAITHKQFTLWKYIFKILDITVDYWDVTHNNGFSVDSSTGSHHENSWREHCAEKLILYPHCNLDLVSGSDIVQHFNQAAPVDGPSESGIVLFLPETISKVKYNNVMMKKLLEKGEKLNSSDDAYSGRHPFKPDLYKKNSPHIKLEKRLLRDLEHDNPSRLPVVYSHYLNARSIGLFHYSYGSIDLRRFPILRSSKLLGVGSMSFNMSDLGADDANLTPLSTEIPVASNFGQAFLATLFGLSVTSKLKLLKANTSLICSLSFYLPNRLHISCEDIVMAALSRDIAHELYNFSGKSLLMKVIRDDIAENSTSYKYNGRIMLRGLSLAKKEAQFLSTKLNHPSAFSACKEIADLSNEVASILTDLGIITASLEELISCDVLQDQKFLHCCHTNNM